MNTGTAAVIVIQSIGQQISLDDFQFMLKSHLQLMRFIAYQLSSCGRGCNSCVPQHSVKFAS